MCSLFNEANVFTGKTLCISWIPQQNFKLLHNIYKWINSSLLDTRSVLLCTFVKSN